MSVFAIQLESRRKARPRVCVDAPPGSARLPCACLAWEVPLYLAELLLCFTSGAECWCGPAVQQLALILPQVVVSEELVELCLHYVLFGFCKIPSWSWKTRVISQDSPQIGWKKQALCVGEVGSRNEGVQGEVLGERSPGKEEAVYI